MANNSTWAAFAAALSLAIISPALAQGEPSTLRIEADKPGATINRNLFGQFVEHLGNGVYGGIWVGKDSKIPNVRGIRSDVVAALRAIKVPVVRWPGGCFADQYNWRHGIGPANRRVSTVNMWGNVIEPNTFGTDEYMDFVSQIGSEAYISVNLGSRSPAEAAEWLEYLTTDQPSTLGKLRAANGHPAPYRVKYLGLGNESWGCGGGLTGEEYVSELKRFGTFTHNLNPAQNGVVRWVKSPDAMEKIAVGPESDKIEYTEAVMKAWTQRTPFSWDIDGLSLHFYTGGAKGVLQSPSTDFGEDEYAGALKNTLRMEELVRTHSAIMDKYDPEKKVALFVDEWGIWLSPLKGTNFMFMRQQGSLRDAMIAALNLNIFARHADRVRMANIAQMANVIHSLILTDGPSMLLTPTYHVHKMYLPFQDATLIPVTYAGGSYTFGDVTLPQVDVIAARGKDGQVWLSLTNLDPERSASISPQVAGMNPATATGEVLTAAKVDAVNTFEAKSAVAPAPYRAESTGGKLVLQLAPKSITVVRLQ